MGLEDSAAEFWMALMRAGGREAALHALSALFECEADSLRGDLDQFVETLTGQGFLKGAECG